MTNLQISNFILRYGGKNIDFYIDSSTKQENASCNFYKPKKNKYLILLQKRLFHNKNYSRFFLQALILHEIGHIKKKHFQRKIEISEAEYEAHLWAIKKAFKYKLINVNCHLMRILLEWENFKRYKNKTKLPYYNAYKKLCEKLGPENIKILKKGFNIK